MRHQHRSAGRVHLRLRGLSFRASLALSLAVSLALLFFGQAQASVFERMRQAIENATGPVYEFVGPPIATARSFIGAVFHITDVYKENERLKAENAELKSWRDKALELEQKVERYEALLEVPLEPDIQYRTGRIVDDPGGPFVRTFRINLGRENGIIEGEAVTGARGLVGRVVSAGGSASRILLITDLNSRVPVMIEPTSSVLGTLIERTDAPPVIDLPKGNGVAIGWRVFTTGQNGQARRGTSVGEVVAFEGSKAILKPAPDLDLHLNTKGPVLVEPSEGLRGILIGQNDSLPIVAYLPREHHVAVGDRVVTSGHGGLLPPGIAVGEVSQIKGDQAIVKPVTDFDRVMYVRVLEYTAPTRHVPHSTEGPPILHAAETEISANAQAASGAVAPVPAAAAAPPPTRQERPQ